MSILIENMEMPEKCGNCFLRDGIFCMASNYERISYNGLEKKESWCPLVEVSSVKSEPKWIPCIERLPNSNGVYLTTRRISDGFTMNNIVDACYFDGADTWHDDTRINHERKYLEDVFAWMPLPEPYREEGE